MRSSHLCLSLLLAIASSYGLAEEQKTLNPTVVDQKDKPAAAATPDEARGTSDGGGDSTKCTQGKATRTVELSYGDATKKLPCAVHYKKDTEQPGSDQVLFKADHDLAFCQGKKQAFVEKLSGMGWSCKGG